MKKVIDTMSKDKSEIISDIAELILCNNQETAKAIITKEYPHKTYVVEKRTYTVAQKMEQFIRDGFIACSFMQNSIS